MSLRIKSILGIILIIGTGIFMFLNLNTSGHEETALIMSPHIALRGPEKDTAFIGTNYVDPGVDFHIEKYSYRNCVYPKVEVIGQVQTNLPGRQILQYKVIDEKQYVSSTISRTVHVVENSAAFLNGVYDVVQTCTATLRGSSSSTISTDNYSATVNSENRNRAFDLNLLKVGPQYVKPECILVADRKIEAGFFVAEFDHKSNCNGFLAEDSNSFTIFTTAYLYKPAIDFKCANIFTKRRLIQLSRK